MSVKTNLASLKSLPGNVDNSLDSVVKVRRVLGIDPGLASTGFGIIDFYKNRYKMVGYGVIETPSSLNHGQRLLTIYDKLCKIIDEFNPSEASMETLYFAKNEALFLIALKAISIVQSTNRLLYASLKNAHMFLSSISFNNSLVKCNPAVGAAALP